MECQKKFCDSQEFQQCQQNIKLMEEEANNKNNQINQMLAHITELEDQNQALQLSKICNDDF